ncbi:MAG: hypothetical protein JWQ44_1105 [Chthoniobacter sp.]|jgi:hypothetical protein|nr:hypothetical protein [Chthoniobacter sp.]
MESLRRIAHGDFPDAVSLAQREGAARTALPQRASACAAPQAQTAEPEEGTISGS